VSVVLLVRHGQASWGATDYDVLSPVGERQSRVLGAALAGRGLVPDLVVHGGMRRQQETARLLVDAARWGAVPREDRGWDEMDHLQVLDRQPHTFAGDEPSAREFQAWFEAATDRWTHGGFDDDYEESFPMFGTRVAAALDRVEGDLGPDGVAVVVTSGGPVARVTARLLGGDADLHRRLAPVVVNTSVTKLVLGSRGTTLVSFNEHSHLESVGPDLLTYR
jgi:broad specificity phosphatase PhoE